MFGPETRRNAYGIPIVEREEPRFSWEIEGAANPLITCGCASDWSEMADGIVEKSINPVSGRLVHGLASSSAVNEHGYALIARGMEADLPTPLLSGHRGHKTPIGEVFYIRRSTDRVYIRAALYESEAAGFAWDLIQRGQLRGFSGAACRKGLKVQGIVERKTFYGSWHLREVSVCVRGANPDAVMEMWDGTDAGYKFFESPIPIGGHPKGRPRVQDVAKPQGPPVERTVVTKRDHRGLIVEFEKHSAGHGLAPSAERTVVTKRDERGLILEFERYPTDANKKTAARPHEDTGSEREWNKNSRRIRCRA
jgi:hypothetical protein